MAKLKDVFGAATSVVKNPDKVVTGGSRPSSNRPSGSSSRPSGGSSSRPSGGSSGSSGNVTGGYNPNLTSKPGGGRNPSSGYDRSPVSGGSGIYGVSDIGKNDRFDHLTGGVDMSRRPDLAGGYATSGGYTVFYDKDGYAVRAKKGVVDYAPHLDYNAGKGTYGTSGAWTDNEMLSAADRKRIQSIRAQMQAGKLTGDEANRLANQIRSGYGYTIDKGGYVTDLGAKGAVDRRRNEWGLPTESLSSEQAYFNYLMGTDTSRKAQESGGVMSFEDYMNSGLVPQQYVPPASSGQWTTPGAGGQWQGSGQWMPGGSMDGFGSGMGDAFQYIKDLYEQQLAADLAALKSTYDQNMADISAQDDLISSEYDKQRNQLAAQNDLQRMQMNEMGILQGLNTGATGQMALAQNVAYQGGLAQLGGQEAQSLADVALEKSKLAAQYRNAAEQMKAQGNAQLASALYDEYVRQQQAAWEYQQAMWDRQRWEQQFAYQKQQDQRDYAASVVNSMLSGGVMPDTSLLEAAGISADMAQAYQQMVLKAANGTGSRRSRTGSKGSSPKPASGSSALTNSAGTAVSPISYDEVFRNSSSGAYGSGYNMVLNDVQAKWARGADLETLAGVVEIGLLNGNLTNEGADSILRALKLNL